MIDFTTIEEEDEDVAYGAILAHYSSRVAARSGVPLMNHIDEGLEILEKLGADHSTRAAYCIHPLVQDDEMLVKFEPGEFDSRTILLAMEYRSVANSYLASATMPEGGIRLSPLPEVNLMLIADKVQNRKDFLAHHLETHPNSKRLAEYFSEWLEALGVDQARYEELVDGL